MLLHIELSVCLVVLLHDMFRTCFLILLRKTFRLVSRVALPRATFGGPGRPFFADGTRPSRGAYRIVGGAQRLASHYALEKPIPALHLTAQVSAELGGAPHRR